MSDQSWFFPDCYLREMESLCIELRRFKGQDVPDTIPLTEVLVMAQAFGAWKQGQVDKAGGIVAWLKGERKHGRGRVEQRNRNYRKALDYLELRDESADHVEPDPVESVEPVEPIAEAQENLSALWGKIQDLYVEHAPATWPKLKRRLRIGNMSTKLQEAVSYAGGVDELLAVIECGLRKVPNFYRTQYVNAKGSRDRTAGSCLQCLLSGDRHSKDLGVSGWRCFIWCDSLDADEVKPVRSGDRHPAEAIIAWTGTRWTRRSLTATPEECEAACEALKAAGLAPADA